MISMTERPRATLLSHDPGGLPGQILMAAATPNISSFSNSTGVPQGKLIIRTEEVVIVTLVLVLWVAAIALFFNRWGKIRMLEPYQPKFIQQHRPSCPLIDPVQHRSFSKFNINSEPCRVHNLRPRQNSVFVGSSVVTLPMNPPRKVKSAFDLQNLVLSDPALHRSAIRLNLGGDPLRRSSLRAPLSPYPESPSQFRQLESERRLSFKDLEECHRVERVQCCIEREPTEADLIRRARKIGELKQNKSLSSQSSVSDRHEGATELKPQSSRPDRRSSLMPAAKDPDGSGVANFRRNSVMFINSVENDRTYLAPRNEGIKSGVIDFRRNSMLIINNLNEEIGVRSFGRNMSLGGSNVNLGFSDYPYTRRGSVIPPFCHDYKPKVAIPHVSIMKTKPSFSNVKSSSLVHGNEGKFLANQKPSKSLDCADATKNWRRTGKMETSPEAKGRFLAPATAQRYAGSSASLNADTGQRQERNVLDESKSTGNLATDKAEVISPLIVETKCCVRRTDDDNEDDEEEVVVLEGASLASSLSNVSTTGAIPLTVTASPGGSGKTESSHVVDMSHV